MPKLEANNFVDLVRKSGLVDDKQLAQTLSDLEQPLGDSGIVCSSLINAGLLTPWQTEQLLSGKHQGFFLGKYKMLDKLGRGGMSSVYLAEHLEMGRRVAIKVLTVRLADRPEYLDRFKAEARAAARVDHPNIVRAYDVGHEGRIHYLVMEYIQGIDLQQMVIERGPLEFRVAADYIRQAAVGLAHVHQAELIHRDIKPANFLVDVQGTLKIVDLGLARLAEETRESLEDGAGEQVLGTVDYLAPEQSVDSHNVTARVDIYSLGCSLYFLLTGKPPFPTGTFVERVRMHRSKEPQNIFELRPDAPPALVAICQRMMAKLPDDRYQTAEEVVEVLQSWLDGKASRTLSMMAVRPPRAPAASPPTDKANNEELTLAPIDDEPSPASSAIQKAKPAVAASPPTPSKSGVIKGAGVTKPAEHPPAASPKSEATPRHAPPTLEPLKDVIPDLGGLLEDLPASTSGVGLPNLNVRLSPAASSNNSGDKFPRWLLIVAGIVLVGVLSMVVWLVVTASS